MSSNYFRSSSGRAAVEKPAAGIGNCEKLAKIDETVIQNERGSDDENADSDSDISSAEDNDSQDGDEIIFVKEIVPANLQEGDVSSSSTANQQTHSPEGLVQQIDGDGEHGGVTLRVVLDDDDEKEEGEEVSSCESEEEGEAKDEEDSGEKSSNNSNLQSKLSCSAVKQQQGRPVKPDQSPASTVSQQRQKRRGD